MSITESDYTPELDEQRFRMHGAFDQNLRSTAMNLNSELRELTVDEIDLVAGGGRIEIGPLYVETDGRSISLGIKGVGGVVIDGPTKSVCGSVKGVGHGCV